MSHFTVLVIGPDHESQLAPFQENNMGDCPREFLAFHDQEDEFLKEWKDGTSDRVVMPDGRKLYTFDDEFRVPGTFGTSIGGSPSHVVPAHLTVQKFPFSELYETFEAFVEDYHGRAKRDPAKKRFGYWENPNAKWDWYSVGGRWTGFFNLKPGREGMTGEPGVGGAQVTDAQLADQCLKGDIDINLMRAEAIEAAGKAYDLALKIVGDLPVHRSWEIVRAEHDNNVDLARKTYHAQPRLVAWRKAESAAHADRKTSYWPFGFFENPDFLLTQTREKYLANASSKAISTHAVVKDGKWYERGTMGWWGSVHDEKDEETWLSMFAKLIDDLPEDTLFTVVDCHI